MNRLADLNSMNEWQDDSDASTLTSSFRLQIATSVPEVPLHLVPGKQGSTLNQDLQVFLLKVFVCCGQC
jgi:hypothetical protein